MCSTDTSHSLKKGAQLEKIIPPITTVAQFLQIQIALSYCMYVCMCVCVCVCVYIYTHIV